MKRIVQILSIASLLWVPFYAAAEKAPKSLAAGSSGRGLCDENFGNYRERLHKDPNDTAAWQELRVCAELLKRWGEAGAISTAAIERGIQRPEPHMILGMAHYRMKDYASALDDFKEAVRIKDDQAIAYFQLGLTYLHLNQPEDAVAAGVRAAELEPTNSAYHHQLAFSYFLVHEDEKCEIEAKRALEIDPNDIAAYKILNSLYTRQGKKDLAAQMLEQSIHANGRVAAAHPFVPDKQLTEADMPHPFKVATPVSDTEIFLKAQWEKMKSVGVTGDVEATASFYSVDGTQEVYRQSFQKMGPARMQQVFSKLGEISDCELDTSNSYATCRCPVNGGSGTMLETKVRLIKDPDHIWRIKAF